MYNIYQPNLTATYCQYLEEKKPRQKPTYIWLFEKKNGEYQPIDTSLKYCKAGSRCPVSAPRGSGKGTEGIEWKERIKVPKNLCIELLMIIEKNENDESKKIKDEKIPKKKYQDKSIDDFY